MKPIEFRWLDYDQQLMEVTYENQVFIKNYEEVLTYCFETKRFDELQTLEQFVTKTTQDTLSNEVNTSQKSSSFRWLNYEQRLIEIKTGNAISIRKYEDALTYYFDNELFDELNDLEQLAIQLPKQRETACQTVKETSIEGEYMETIDCDPRDQTVLYMDNEYNKMDLFDYFGHILPDQDKTRDLENLLALRKTGALSVELEQVLAQFIKFSEYKNDRKQTILDECYKQMSVMQAKILAKQAVFKDHVASDLSLSLALKALLEDYEYDANLIVFDAPDNRPWYGCGYLDPVTEDYRIIDIKTLVETTCKEEIFTCSLREISVDSKNYLKTQINVDVVDEESADCIEMLSLLPLDDIIEILDEEKQGSKHTLQYINEQLSTGLYQKEYCPDLWKKYSQSRDFMTMVCYAKEQVNLGKYDELSVALLLADHAANDELEHWLVNYTAQGKSCWGNLIVEEGDCYICTKGEAMHLYQTISNQSLDSFITEIQSPDRFCQMHPEATVHNPYFLNQPSNSSMKLSVFSNTLIYQTRLEEPNLEDFLLEIPKRLRKIKK